VQWAFSSLSPRLTLFRDDPIVWRAFAFVIGVFVFSVTTALVIGDQQKVSVIVPMAEVVAVLAAIAMIRALQVRAFASIQLVPHRQPSPGRVAASSTTSTPGHTQRSGSQLPRCRHGTGPSHGRTARRSCSNST
jgi:hypothetical protein